MFSIASPWVPTMPNPDGGFASAADRQHIAFMYRGIAAAAVSGTLIGQWSKVILCQSSNQRIDVISENKRIECQ